MSLFLSFWNLLEPFNWFILALMIVWLSGSLISFLTKNTTLFSGVGVFLLTSAMWSNQLMSDQFAVRDIELSDLKTAMLVVDYNLAISELRVDYLEDIALRDCLGEVDLEVRKLEDCMNYEFRESTPEGMLGEMTSPDTSGDRVKMIFFYIHFSLVVFASFQMALGGLLIKPKPSTN